MKTIGYLGPQGSFSEEALQSFMITDRDFSKGYTVAPYNTIPELLRACESKLVDKAFIPLENSTEGQVSAALDTLRETEDLYIIREFVHPIEQCLLSPGIFRHHEIERIYSHEQALGQCREFLTTNLPQTEQIKVSSTAEAARMVAGTKEKWAAIGPRRSAELYKLHCLNAAIQDTILNATRFVLVGRQLNELTDEAKTSFLLITENVPGALYKVLQEFALRNINLTKIESRPSKRKLGEYVFFIDVDGYVFSPPIQEVLAAFKEKRVIAKLLGSYPKALNQL